MGAVRRVRIVLEGRRDVVVQVRLAVCEKHDESLAASDLLRRVGPVWIAPEVEGVPSAGAGDIAEGGRTVVAGHQLTGLWKRDGRSDRPYGPSCRGAGWKPRATAREGAWIEIGRGPERLRQLGKIPYPPVQALGERKARGRPPLFDRAYHGEFVR